MKTMVMNDHCSGAKHVRNMNVKGIGGGQIVKSFSNGCRNLGTAKSSCKVMENQASCTSWKRCRAEQLKNSSEECIGKPLDGQAVFMQWLVALVGTLLTHMKVCADGVAPYERLKGTCSRTLMALVGRSVMCKA